jgi:hypothetical protein
MSIKLGSVVRKKGDEMKILAGALIILLAVGLIVGWIVAEVRADYEYDNTIQSYWALSEKASTLQQKTSYLDKYVGAIEAAKLSGNDALVFKTPDNSYEQNLIALKSLQVRLHQIQGMDEQSFAYQTAIQQITAQEQGEAQKLTATFEGLWYLQHHFLLWDWIDFICWIGLIGLLVVAIVIAVALAD